MSVIYIIDLLGTMVFAISGSMAAHRKRIDIFGATFTGFITAIGGGSLRDVFLNLRPVWVDDSNYLLVILLGVFISSVFNKELDRLARTLTFFDAIGIGFLRAVGVQKSLLYESSEAAAVVLGMFSGVMGGVTRDTLLNETPRISRKEIYATHCGPGALLFVILKGLHVRDDVNTFVSSSIVFIIRIISVKYKFTLPVIGRRID